MFRPSRPMIRPFISSPGRCSTETTDSLVCSLATRWMASVTIRRARCSPSRRAALSVSRTSSAASRLAWFWMPATSSALAWSAVSPAVCSSTTRRSSSSRSRSARRPSRSWRTLSSPAERSSSLPNSVSSRASRSASRASRRSRSARSSRASSRDRAQFLVRVPAGLGRLVGGLPGLAHDGRGIGFGPGADLVRFPAGVLEGALRVGGELGLAGPGVGHGLRSGPGTCAAPPTSAKTAASRPMAPITREIVLLMAHPNPARWSPAPGCGARDKPCSEGSCPPATGAWPRHRAARRPGSCRPAAS